jgi:hypothetical protein
VADRLFYRFSITFPRRNYDRINYCTLQLSSRRFPSFKTPSLLGFYHALPPPPPTPPSSTLTFLLYNLPDEKRNEFSSSIGPPTIDWLIHSMNPVTLTNEIKELDGHCAKSRNNHTFNKFKIIVDSSSNVGIPSLTFNYIIS